MGLAADLDGTGRLAVAQLDVSIWLLREATHQLPISKWAMPHVAFVFDVVSRRIPGWRAATASSTSTGWCTTPTSAVSTRRPRSPTASSAAPAWCDRDDRKSAAPDWVTWFGADRTHEAVGDLTPLHAERVDHRHHADLDEAQPNHQPEPRTCRGRVTVRRSPARQRAPT